jgi:hypothetical protein
MSDPISPVRLAPAFSQSWQNFLSVELDEVRLIVAGGVENQVREA